MALRVLGFSRYRELVSASNCELREVTIYPNQPPFTFRPTSPDVSAIIQNLVREEWGQFRIDNVYSILDGGAYIGDTSYYFACKYPKSRIIAVEPNKVNHPILERNLAAFSDRASIAKAGIWHESCQLTFSGEFTGARIEPSPLIGEDSKGDQIVNCLSINKLLSLHNLDRFDIVKLDIEGSEESVLTQNVEWLSKARLVLVEFHGASIESKCTCFLKQNNFRHFTFRSVHYFYR